VLCSIIVCGAQAWLIYSRVEKAESKSAPEAARELAKEILQDNKGHLASTNLNIGDSLGLLALLVGVVLVLNYRLVT
jgi:hypothetical protein